MDNVITKSHWVTDKQRIRASMPITKVDKERRIVSGFATLNNLDKQDDIVPLEASKEAFERFRGNVREMHLPVAVGKVISFRDEDYFDEQDGQVYKGIYVDVYVSKGSQPTWEKVLDGTLTGFSIGGVIHEDTPVYDETLGKVIRVVKKYDLTELSLVDNPANQLANIFSIEKLEDGTIKYDGLITKTQVENVLWCSKDGIVRLSQEGDDCPVCAIKMQNIGFVESDDSEKNVAVKAMLDNFKKTIVLAANAEIAKEESNVAEETVVEKVADEAAEEIEKVADEATNLAVPANDGVDLAKAVEDIGAVANAVGELTALVKDAAQAQTAGSEELAKAIADLRADVDALKSFQSEFGKRVEAVEADTAVRKSGDLGEVVQEEAQVKKSIWGGKFLNADGLSYR